MKRLSYNVFRVASRLVGLWVLKLFAWIVSSGYFFFCPKRVGIGLAFYRALFPDRRRLVHLWYTWRQYHHFARVFVERVMLETPDNILFSTQGFQHLKTAADRGTGGVILMSHLGNWEVAAHLLHRDLPRVNLLIFMGIKEKEAIEKMQKQGLTDAGIQIVAPDHDNPSPFDIVQGLRVLEQGGVVCITGDVLWHKSQRSIPVEFLGHEVRVPETPYRLTLISGAPMFIFFSHRTGEGRFYFTCSEPIHVQAASRDQTEETIQKAAQTYAIRLARAVKEHPFEWYHFEPFLGPPWIDPPTD